MALKIFLLGLPLRRDAVCLILGITRVKTSTGISFCIAGRRVAGCSTFAPKYANSAASVKLMVLMRRASGQMFGSVVIIAIYVGPYLDARSGDAAPDDGCGEIRNLRARAWWVMPSRVEPMNPPITGIRPCCTSGTDDLFSGAIQLSVKSGVALPKLLSVMMQRRESTWLAGSPRALRASVTMRLEMRSP